MPPTPPMRLRWKSLRARQPGYLSFKSYAADDGEVIALSEWRDEDSRPRMGPAGRTPAVQQRGRAEYYEDYTLFACADPRIHRFTRKDMA